MKTMENRLERIENRIKNSKSPTILVCSDVVQNFLPVDTARQQAREIEQSGGKATIIRVIYE